MMFAEYFRIIFHRSVLIIADLLTSKLLNVYELDPARRHLPSYHRGSQRYTQTRYSAFEKGAGDVSRQISLLLGARVRFLAMLGSVRISHFQSLIFKPVFEHCVGLWGDAHKLD